MNEKEFNDQLRELGLPSGTSQWYRDHQWRRESLNSVDLGPWNPVIEVTEHARWKARTLSEFRQTHLTFIRFTQIISIGEIPKTSNWELERAIINPWDFPSVWDWVTQEVSEKLTQRFGINGWDIQEMSYSRSVPTPDGFISRVHPGSQYLRIKVCDGGGRTFRFFTPMTVTLKGVLDPKVRQYIDLKFHQS